MQGSTEPEFYGPWPKVAQGSYRPRDPSEEVLFQVFQEHLDQFLEDVALGSDGHGLPSFVEEELQKYKTCGDLRGGFTRFQCRRCGFERLLPRSCGGRGFCSACLARRAAERAAHIVDRVVPYVPVRQYVLSLPIPLRYLLAWRHQLCVEVLGIFADALGAFYSERARDQGIVNGKTGMIVVIQRYGGSLNLNIHGHLTCLDGVFARTSDGVLTFHEAPLPTQKDITVLCSVVRHQVLALLVKRGLLGDDIDPFAEDEPLLASIASASLTSRIATGQRASRPVLRLASLPPVVKTRKKQLCAHIDGFDLHAGAALAAKDRKALEALLRYQLRPPLSKTRLTPLDDGRLKLRLRTPYDDGTTTTSFRRRSSSSSKAKAATPHELLERLASLVPRPHKNLVIYRGCLAPRAADRDQIVAFGRPLPMRQTTVPQKRAFDFELLDDQDDRPPSRYYSWSELIARVFGAQVLRCPRCNSTLRFIAMVTAPFAIKAILDHIGLSSGPRKLPLPTVKGQLSLFEPQDLRQALAPPASCRSPPPSHGPSQDQAST